MRWSPTTFVWNRGDVAEGTSMGVKVRMLALECGEYLRKVLTIWSQQKTCFKSPSLFRESANRALVILL